MTPAPALLAGVLAALAVLAILVVAGRVAPALTSPARPLRPSAAGRRRPRRLPWSRHRPAAPDEDAVACWCLRVAGGVRSGSSLTQAVVDADRALDGSSASPFPEVVHAVRRGRPLGEAFRATPGDPRTPIGLAAPVLATCAELGGPAAGPVEHIAAVLSARMAEREERRAASAQARLSGRVLTIVPLGVLALLALTEPTMRTALTTPAGSVCLAVGAALDFAGWAWMRRMIGATA